MADETKSASAAEGSTAEAGDRLVRRRSQMSMTVYHLDADGRRRDISFTEVKRGPMEVHW